MNANTQNRAPCPCGSGRRYRRCHGTARRRGFPITPHAMRPSSQWETAYSSRVECVLCSADLGELRASRQHVEWAVTNALASLCPSCSRLPDARGAVGAALRNAPPLTAEDMDPTPAGGGRDRG